MIETLSLALPTETNDINQSLIMNRRIVLNSRPTGRPTAGNFRLERVDLPTPSDGQILLRTLYLSLDPYMRGRMNEGPSYAPAVEVGELMEGGTVSRVVGSLHPDFQPGDLVLGNGGWQDYSLSDGAGIRKWNQTMGHPSLALGVLGMPGFTAYMGLLDIGRPKLGETLVVAAASGAVGSVVGQIGKIKGCYVVGIAGGEEKCRYVVEVLGFDACVDHSVPDFPQRLSDACSHGIDIYFESVGGPVFDAVLPLLNVNARIPLCGLIAHYNEGGIPDGPDTLYSDNGFPQAPDRLGLLMSTLLTKRIKIQGFIIFADYGSHFEEFVTQMSAWLKEDKIKYREDMVEGLDRAPEALIGLLEGKNFGKVVVRVTHHEIGQN